MRKIYVEKKERDICQFCGYPLIDGCLFSPIDKTKFCKIACVREYYATDKEGEPNVFIDGVNQG